MPEKGLGGAQEDVRLHHDKAFAKEEGGEKVKVGKKLRRGALFCES
jgi:hypothetical protein